MGDWKTVGGVSQFLQRRHLSKGVSIDLDFRLALDGLVTLERTTVSRKSMRNSPVVNRSTVSDVQGRQSGRNELADVAERHRHEHFFWLGRWLELDGAEVADADD